MPDKIRGSTKTLHRSIGERLRVSMHLTRLDRHLEAVMPGKKRGATVKELRKTLASGPKDVTPPREGPPACSGKRAASG